MVRSATTVANRVSLSLKKCRMNVGIDVGRGRDRADRRAVVAELGEQPGGDVKDRVTRATVPRASSGAPRARRVAGGRHGTRGIPKLYGFPRSWSSFYMVRSH